MGELPKFVSSPAAAYLSIPKRIEGLYCEAWSFPQRCNIYILYQSPFLEAWEVHAVVWVGSSALWGEGWGLINELITHVATLV